MKRISCGYGSLLLLVCLVSEICIKLVGEWWANSTQVMTLSFGGRGTMSSSLTPEAAREGDPHTNVNKLTARDPCTDTVAAGALGAAVCTGALRRALSALGNPPLDWSTVAAPLPNDITRLCPSRPSRVFASRAQPVQFSSGGHQNVTTFLLLFYYPSSTNLPLLARGASRILLGVPRIARRLCSLN